MDLCNLEELKKLLGRHGFRFSKSMGQNFLIESWVPRQTAEASGAGSGVGVLEIGPGVGTLTVQLASLADRVVAVELDKSLLPVLSETMEGYPNVEIVPGDALKLNLGELCREKMPDVEWVVCANLPYNITTPVLTALLEAGCFSTVTVMIQREVALRICASPGTSDYGAFSVFCRYHADCELLYDVPPACFYPVPKVTSSVIRMTIRKKPPVPIKDPKVFFRVVRAAFAQRRKTLLNALSAAFGADFSKDELRAVLTSCGFQENVRGEQLGILEFATLSTKLSAEQ